MGRAIWIGFGRVAGCGRAVWIGIGLKAGILGRAERIGLMAGCVVERF